MDLAAMTESVARMTFLATGVSIMTLLARITLAEAGVAAAEEGTLPAFDFVDEASGVVVTVEGMLS